MEVIKTTKKDSKKTAKSIKERGYISRDIVIKAHYREKYSLPEYKKLRELAENKELKSIKVNTDGNISYWFLREEIESYFIENKDISELYKESFYKIRDKIISDIEKKANEVLGILDSEILASGAKVKESKDVIVIKCPYTIGAVQKIFTEGVKESFKMLKRKYIIEYAEKKDELDSMVIEKDNWDSKQSYTGNYYFAKS